MVKLRGQPPAPGEYTYSTREKGLDETTSMCMIPEAVFPRLGGNMRSVNGFFLFDLGQIWQLTHLMGGVAITPNLPLIGQSLYILGLFVNYSDNQNELPDSTYEAKQLINVLNAIIQNPTANVTSEQHLIIQHTLVRFRALLNSELGKVFTFVVEEKRGFNSATLWRSPSKLLSMDTISLLSEFVTSNLDEAAKCLLLDRHTAVGFHVLRSVECVARVYYQLITGTNPPYINRHGEEYFKQLGSIIQELKGKHELLHAQNRSTGSLSLVVGNLSPLCQLYRNPLSHPEIETLTQDEAVNALIQVISVIDTMILDAKRGGEHFIRALLPGQKF